MGDRFVVGKEIEKSKLIFPRRGSSQIEMLRQFGRKFQITAWRFTVMIVLKRFVQIMVKIVEGNGTFTMPHEMIVVKQFYEVLDFEK